MFIPLPKLPNPELNRLPDPEIQPSWINIDGEDILQIGVPRRDINVGTLNRNESSWLAATIKQLRITWIRNPDYITDWVLRAIMLSENEKVGQYEIRTAITEMVGNADDLDGLIFDTMYDLSQISYVERCAWHDDFTHTIRNGMDWWVQSEIITLSQKPDRTEQFAKLTRIGRIVKELCFGTEMEVRVE